ncbi:MAG: ABC transporter permease [Vicinamibacterales bacterium]
MTPQRSPLARFLAALFIRGPEAPFILRDLDDAFLHDVTRGLSPAEVRRRDLGNVAASAVSIWAETLRPSAWRPSLLDVRLGLRSIVRTPGLSLVAVCALAIGIPVGLAPMHVVDALERPLPGDPDGRIRTLCYWRDTAHEPATTGDYALWQESLRSFDTLAAFRTTTVNIERGDVALVVPAIETTASTFEIVPTSPMLGRGLRADDETRGAPGVAVLGYDLWQAQFGGDLDIVGRRLSIGGEPVEVIGVMPEGFRFPTAHQLWLPLRVRDDGGGPRTGETLTVFGRLGPGATPESAAAELRALTSALATTNRDTFERLRPEVLPAWHLAFDFPSPGGLRDLPEFPLVRVLMLAPLLVACVNVGLLILAHTSTRSSEFAVRTALGASRGRILTQVFVEFMVLAVLAAGVGLLILDWLPARLVTALGITVPYWMDYSLHAATVWRGLALAAGCAVLAGVVPAYRMTGRSVDANIKTARAPRSGNRLGGLPSALIVTDVAVAVVAIGVAAGLWGKVQVTMPNESADGIRAGEFLSITLQVPSATREHASRTQTAFVDRLRAEPGVRAVTFASALPRMDHPTRLLQIEPRAAGEAVAPGPFRVRTARVATEFLGQLGQPILAGRDFETRDLGEFASTVIVNTTFAQRAFGTANPVGRRVREVSTDGMPNGPWREIVGVVGHLGAHAITPSEDDAAYLPLAAGEANPVRIAVRAGGGTAALASRIREIATAVDPAAVVTATVPLDAMFEGDWYLLRLFVLAAVILVGVLLSLATSALYAILSLVVSRRTREIGIRVALGASRREIARDVSLRAVAQISVGVLLGLPLAGALCYEFLELTGSNHALPGAVTLALALGVMVMVLVATTACTVPTLRALRITPTDALRQDA